MDLDSTPTAQMKIFVCGTYADLTRERRAVLFVSRSSTEYNAMERLGARPDLPIPPSLPKFGKATSSS